MTTRWTFELVSPDGPTGLITEAHVELQGAVITNVTPILWMVTREWLPDREPRWPWGRRRTGTLTVVGMRVRVGGFVRTTRLKLPQNLGLNDTLEVQRGEYQLALGERSWALRELGHGGEEAESVPAEAPDPSSAEG